MKKRIFIAMTLCVGLSGIQLISSEDKDSSALLMQSAATSKPVACDATIRYVDIFAVMGEAEPGKIEQQELETKSIMATQEIQEESKVFEKAKSEYVSKSSTMTDKARDNEEKKLIKMERDLKNMATEKKEELNIEMQRATERLAQGAEAAVIEYAQQEKIDVVCDKMTGKAIYVSPSFDITDNITKKVNEKYRIKKTEEAKKNNKVKMPSVSTNGKNE